MTAAAPALATVQRRIAVVRLGDVAKAVTSLSFLFGLLLVVFPISFPRMIVISWLRGRLMPIMMVLTFLIDTFVYLRAAQMQSAKPRPLAVVCLGSLPLLVVAGLGLLLESAVGQTIAWDMPNLQARIGEEILAHTYLGLVAAIFLPFLVIRLLQRFEAANS